jgi:translation initiation factor 2B subunit (eIF-2B alpha/beta/delta family)
MENGGTVNNIGTFALGVVAKEMGVPLDVAAKRYKILFWAWTESMMSSHLEYGN